MKKIGKIMIWALFIAYCIVMVYLLFLRSVGKTYPYTYREYLTTMINFIPFKNLYIYITTPRMTLAIIKEAVVNIVGNIIIFIPAGILLPCLFKQLTNFKKYLFSMTIVIIIIEVSQLLLMLGMCDIDDLILNLIGSILGFAILKTKFVQNIINN